MIDKKKTFLATTALSEFWDRSAEIHFLGEWCLLHGQNDQWEGLSYKILDYPWDDPKKLREASLCCDAFYEEILKQLTGFLNGVHGTQHSIDYWRIVVGDWLWRYIQVLYDRYICLKKALENNEEISSIILEEESYQYPKDSLDFFGLCCTDVYNLQMYSQILRLLNFNFPTKNYMQKEREHSLYKRILADVKGFTREMFKVVRSLLVGDRCESEVVFCALGMPDSIIHELNTFDKIKCHELVLRKSMRKNIIDQEVRSRFAVMEADNEFHRICLKTLQYNFPVELLEGYKSNVANIAQQTESFPKIVLTAAGWRFNMNVALYIAEVKEKGAKIFGIQHGGGYGLFEVDSMFEHELRIVDRFLSWGWTNGNQKILALPQPRLSQEAENNGYMKKRSFILIGTNNSRYQNIFQSSPLGPQFKTYIEHQIKFFSMLSEDIQKMFLVRLYPVELGWCNKKRLECAVPGLRYDDYRKPFFQQIKESRLVICDNNQTTYLQSIGLNIPTIIFWDENIWQVRKSGKPIFHELKQVQIYHETPQSAAEFISNNHSYIEEWWASEDVQEVVKKFQFQYCRTSPQWKNEWQNKIYQELGSTN